MFTMRRATIQWRNVMYRDSPSIGRVWHYQLPVRMAWGTNQIGQVGFSLSGWSFKRDFFIPPVPNPNTQEGQHDQRGLTDVE